VKRMQAVRLPKKILERFPMWEFQCPICHTYYEEQPVSCSKCGTLCNNPQFWRVPPRFLKNYKAMSEYAHRRIIPTLSKKEQRYWRKFFTTIFTADFETYQDYSDFDATSIGGSNTMAVVTDRPHKGSYSSKHYVVDENQGCWARKDFTAQTELYMRVYVNVDERSNGTAPYFFTNFFRGFDPCVKLGTLKSGNGVSLFMRYWNGTSLVNDQSSTVLSLDTWYCIELYYKCAVSGEVRVYVDGTEDTDLTNTGFDSSGVTNLQRASIGHWQYGEGPATGDSTYFIDDVVIADEYIGPAVDQFTKTFTLDAILIGSPKKHFTLDALLKGTLTKDFTLDARLIKRHTKVFSIDGILVTQGTKTFTLDAIVSGPVVFQDPFWSLGEPVIPQEDYDYWSLGEPWIVLRITAVAQETKTFTLDALLKAELTKTFTLDALLQSVSTKTLTVDAILLAVQTKTFTLDAYLKATLTKSFELDALLQKTQIKTFSVDALLRATLTKPFTLDAILVEEGIKTKSFTLDALLQKVQTKTFLVDALLRLRGEKTFAIDAILQATLEKTFSLDALLLKTVVKTFTLDAILKSTAVKTLTLDAILKATQTKTFTLDAILSAPGVFMKQFTLDALLKGSSVKTFTIDALLQTSHVKTLTLDAILLLTSTKSFTLDGLIRKTSVKTFTLDAIIVGLLPTLFAEITETADDLGVNITEEEQEMGVTIEEVG